MNEAKKNDFWPEMARPFVVLLVICLVVSALLGVTHKITSPVIEQNALAAAEEARKAVLPAATSFEEVEVPADIQALGVTGFFKGDNGTGYVVTANGKGYGGDVGVTIGFDTDGKILSMQADVSGETQGVGSKVGGMMDRFEGLTGTADGVELKTGATYTSNAVRSAVNAAFSAVAKLG